MTRLFILGGICGLLLAMPSPCSAGVNYNSSKSNTGNFVLTYSPDVVSGAQAAAILGDLDKTGAQVMDETTLRGILKTHGVRNDHIRKIIIEPVKSGRQDGAIFLLENPRDEAQARSAYDRNTASHFGRRAH
jgi:hypothetical protein